MITPSPKPPKREKKQKKHVAHRSEKKKKLESIAHFKQRLQTKVVNPYIRKRDSRDGWFICISCGKTKTLDQLTAGHYVPIGKSQFLRFHEWNVNGECINCNAFDKFHLVGYRKNLIVKIGLSNVEWLDRIAEEVKTYKFTRKELEQIEEKYKMLTENL